MNNLNAFGLKHIAVYLEDYSKGLLSFKEVCNYLSCCFEDRKTHDWGKSETHPRMPSLMRKKNARNNYIN